MRQNTILYLDSAKKSAEKCNGSLWSPGTTTGSVWRCCACSAPPRPVCLWAHDVRKKTLWRSEPTVRTVGSDPVRVFVVGSWRALGMWALTGAGAGRRRKVVLVGFVCFLERGSATQFIFGIVSSWVSRSFGEEMSLEAASFTSCKWGLWFIAKH